MQEKKDILNGGEEANKNNLKAYGVKPPCFN